VFDQILAFLVDSSANLAKQFLRTCLAFFDEINNESFIWTTATTIHASGHVLLRTKDETGFYLPRIEMFREILRSICGSNPPPFVVVSTGARPVLPMEIEYGFYSHNSTSFDFDFLFGDDNLYVYANRQNKKAAAAVLTLIDPGVAFVLRPTSRPRNSAFHCAVSGLKYGRSNTRWNTE
jgi:hypothetical protein